MATGTFKVVAASDNAYTAQGFDTYTSGSFVRVGNNQYPNEGYLRFPSVTIPSGSTITSAKITLYARDNFADGVGTYLKIRGNDVSTAVAPVSYAEYMALALTTASIDWDPGNWTLDTAYDSGDITTIIQEIIDGGSWASGNAIAILLKDDTSTQYIIRDGYGIGDGIAAKYPALYVEWTPPVIYADITETLTVTETPVDNLPVITETVTLTTSDLGTQTTYTTTLTDTLTVTEVLAAPKAHEAAITETIIATDADIGNLSVLIHDTLNVGDSISAVVSYINTRIAYLALPALTLESKGSEKGNFSKSLKALTVIASTGAALDVSLPFFELSTTAHRNITTELSRILPHFTISATGLAGLIGDLSARTGIITSSGTTHDSGTNSLSVSMAVMIASISAHNAGRFTNYTLQYTRST
jgi:hypothetical protein